MIQPLEICGWESAVGSVNTLLSIHIRLNLWVWTEGYKQQAVFRGETHVKAVPCRSNPRYSRVSVH